MTKHNDKSTILYNFEDKLYSSEDFFEIKIDIDKNDENYEKLVKIFRSGRKSIFCTMEDIYRLQKEKEWLSRRPAHRTTIIKEDSVKKIEIWIDNK